MRYLILLVMVAFMGCGSNSETTNPSQPGDSGTTNPSQPGDSGPWQAVTCPINFGIMSAATHGGKIYLYGSGFANEPTLQVYNPAADVWNLAAPPVLLRTFPSFETVGDRLYLIGGYINFALVSDVEEYDPVSDTWLDCGAGCAAMPTPRGQFPATAAADGRIYTVGANSTIAEVYDPATNAWTLLGGTANNHYWGGAEEIGGIVYAVGGSTGFVGVYDVESYDTAQSPPGVWVAKAPLPTVSVPFDKVVTVVYQGAIHAILAKDQSITAGLRSDPVFRYDHVSDTWAPPGFTLPEMEFLQQVAVVNDTLYLFGGTPSQSLCFRHAP